MVCKLSEGGNIHVYINMSGKIISDSTAIIISN